MTIEKIDFANMLFPPSPDGWNVEGSDAPRFGWDELYLTKYNQAFSPWRFSKNCSAVLGYVRVHGLSDTMRKMADYLMSIVAPHIESMGQYRYVRNDFQCKYLWVYMQPAFYGAFMNNVTAHGLLYLYEATREERYLLLADRLLMTSVDVDAPVPLCSQVEEGMWLHEYVFQSELESIAWCDYMKSGKWNLARVFNGHIHALFTLMRFREMTKQDFYDDAIAESTRLMGSLLESQVYDNRYFSYCVEMPVYPDYGQERAMLLAESLAELTRDESVMHGAQALKKIWPEVKANNAEIQTSGFSAAEKIYLSAVSKK